ncbi:MAG: serine/threonine-protein phosphatase [Pirellulales bacterium]|nr:serine/threonine-protein phosphatase [Pirellulales bacterium]
MSLAPDSTAANASPERDAYRLQCMEIWGGNAAAVRELKAPGLDLWLSSVPYRQATSGGDVHYVSLCGGGVITRIILADVSGHGAVVAELAKSLRDLMRANINRKSQSRLVRELNRQFVELAQWQRFATAIVATYLADRDTLTICNAGHPRPLWFRAATGLWYPVDTDLNSHAQNLTNLPWGIDETTDYPQVVLRLEPGDRVLFYTDALVEATSPAGNQLGEAGLLQLLDELAPQPTHKLVGKIEERVQGHRANQPADDDTTMLLLEHNASPPGRLSLGEKLNVYAKVFGLKRV